MDFKLKEFNIDVSVTRMANIHYFEFVKEYHTFKDKHPFRELVYVDSGTIKVESDGYCGTLCSNQLLIHKSNEVHSLYCFEDNAPNVVIIGFECDSARLDIFSENPLTLSSEVSKILADIIKEGKAVYMPPYDTPNVKDMKKREVVYSFAADQMLKLKLEMFLIELIRSIEVPQNQDVTVKNDAKIEEIYTYIISHYKERITLDDLCFLFGTNKTYICKSFKNTYGETVINFINRMRIKSAKKLMREGYLNLTQISAEVGFSSIHYFSKLFKAFENQSPSEYVSTIKSKLDM